jgi:hypothetical protein
VAVLQLNAEHRIGQGFDYATLNFDGTVFLGHTVLAILAVGFVSAVPLQRSMGSDYKT